MSRSSRPASGHSLAGVFAVPLLLAVVSIVGLLSALIGDGVWDGLSWAMLGIPILVIGWMLKASRGSGRA